MSAATYSNTTSSTHHATPQFGFGTSAVRPASAQVGRSHDPVVALYRCYVALEAASGPLEARARTLWKSLAARYGDPRDVAAEPKPWVFDGDYPKLSRLNDECDSINMEQADLVDRMRETAATTQEGATAKLRVILDLWHGPDRAGMDQHERTTLEFIEDAIAVLGKGAAQ